MNPNASHTTSHTVSHLPETLAKPVETRAASIEPVLTLAEIAAHLGVSVQALYDLRNKGRGPRGFKVGRRLHFRVSEVDAWLHQLEAEDSCSAATPPATVPTIVPVRPLAVVPDPSPDPSPTPSPAPNAPGVAAVEAVRQELEGDQWALSLDVPRRP